MNFELVWNFFRRAWRSAWSNIRTHNPFQAAAALAFYSLFSLAPLVIVIVSIAGFLIRDADVQAALTQRIETIVNEDAADIVRTMVLDSTGTEQSPLSLIVATALIVIGATTAFAQLHSILNRVWNVPQQRRQSIRHFIKGRLLSFAFLAVIALLLAVSLLFNTFLTNLGEFVEGRFGLRVPVWPYLTVVTSYGVTTLLIATIYKFLPDKPVKSRDALIGAVVASLLFESSKSLVGYYVAHMAPESAFGAAGSVVVFMVWIYVSSLIVLIGAEVSRTFEDVFSNS